MSSTRLGSTVLACTILFACGGSPGPAKPDASQSADVAPPGSSADGGSDARRGTGGTSQGGVTVDAAPLGSGGVGGPNTGPLADSGLADATLVWTQPTVSSGTMVDPRDGNQYKTVTINGLTWMAENLRYIPNDKAISDGAIRCGSKQFDYCATYGAYYSVGTTNPCPPDWRLPTKVEFQALFYAHAIDPVEAATKLRDTSWNGTNDYGFSALPAGYYDSTYAVSTITHARVPMYADNLLMAGFLTSSTKSAGYSYQTAARIFDAEYASGLELYDWSMNSLVMAFNARCVQ